MPDHGPLVWALGVKTTTLLDGLAVGVDHRQPRADPVDPRLPDALVCHDFFDLCRATGPYQALAAELAGVHQHHAVGRAAHHRLFDMRHIEVDVEGPHGRLGPVLGVVHLDPRQRKQQQVRVQVREGRQGQRAECDFRAWVDRAANEDDLGLVVFVKQLRDRQ